MIVKGCTGWLTSLAVAWLHYHENYNMVPYSSIQNCMEVFGAAVNVRSFVKASMKQWNTVLTAGDQRCVNVKIKNGIFQGDSLSPLVFALVMIP